MTATSASILKQDPNTWKVLLFLTFCVFGVVFVFI